MAKFVDKLLPTTMVGSYPRPLWYKHQLHGQDIQHAFKLEEHAQAYEDATVAVLNDQDLAGLDVVADGQMYFDDYGGSIGSFVWYWYERLPGFYSNKMSNPIAMSGGTGRVDFEMMNNWGGTTTVGKIERGPARLAELYQLAQRHTNKPLKVSVGAGPLNLSIHVHYDSSDAYYKSQRELVADLVPVFNAELKELVAAGAEFIQLEDLGAWIPIETGRQEDFKWVVDSMNEMVDGVDAKLAWHFCLGTAYGNTFEIFEGKLEEALSHLHDVNIEQYVLDFALRDMQDLGALQSLPHDKEVAVGVIDVRVLHVESEEEVAERIRRVLEIVPAEQVWLTTDCGLRALPRIVAREKLRSLVGGAEIVRQEIGERSAAKTT